MNRTLLAALVGGIVVFAWGALAHMALPIGEMGFSKHPAEAGMLQSIAAATPESGVYFLPQEAMEKQEEGAHGPYAMLVFKKDLPYVMGMGQLGMEFVSGFLAALVAAMLLACGVCGSSVLCKATAVMGMGLFAWFSISVSQWNWYGFSDGMLIGEGLEQAVGWFLAGLAMAPLLKPKAA